MKKLIAVLLLVTILLGSYVMAGPYIVVNRFQTALQNQDLTMLADCVDFPALRHSLKEQINAALLDDLKQMEEEDPFAIFGIAFLGLVIDGLVDLLLTPSGLGSLALGFLPDLTSGEIEEIAFEQADFFADTRYTLDNFNQASLWVENSAGEEMRFVFSRSGFSWKLSSVVIPFS